MVKILTKVMTSHSNVFYFFYQIKSLRWAFPSTIEMGFIPNPRLSIFLSLGKFVMIKGVMTFWPELIQYFIFFKPCSPIIVGFYFRKSKSSKRIIYNMMDLVFRCSVDAFVTRDDLQIHEMIMLSWMKSI